MDDIYKENNDCLMSMEEETLTRKDSNNSIYYNLPRNNSKNDERHQEFYKKILPGLRGFAHFDSDGFEPSHLDSIDLDYLKASPYESDIHKLFTNNEQAEDFPLPRRKSTYNIKTKQIHNFDLSHNSRKNSNDALKNVSSSWAQYFNSKKLEEVSETNFQKKLENFLFIHLKESDMLVHEAVENFQKQYFTLQYHLKYMISNKYETKKFLNCITDFAINSVDGFQNCINKFDDTYTSNCYSQMAKQCDDNLLSNNNIDKNFSDIFHGTVKSGLISKNNSNNQCSTNSNELNSNDKFLSQSESVSKSGARRIWSKNEQNEMLQILKDHYPSNIQTETINELSIKYGRTVSSITNKLQKMKKEHKNSLEKYLGSMFSKENEVNMVMISSDNLSFFDEKLMQDRKTYVITMLKNNYGKMTFEELRESIPTIFQDPASMEVVLHQLKEDKIIDTLSCPMYYLNQSNICITELIDQKIPAKITNLFIEIFNMFCQKSSKAELEEKQYTFPNKSNNNVKSDLSHGQIVEGISPNLDIDLRDIEKALNLLIKTDVVLGYSQNYIVLLKDMLGS